MLSALRVKYTTTSWYWEIRIPFYEFEFFHHQNVPVAIPGMLKSPSMNKQYKSTVARLQIGIEPRVYDSLGEYPLVIGNLVVVIIDTGNPVYREVVRVPRSKLLDPAGSDESSAII